MYADKFRKVMCTALEMQLYGSKYVWITVGSWYSDEWRKVRDMDCEGNQLKEEPSYLLEIRPLLLSTSHESTISGKTAAQLEKEYEERLSNFRIAHPFLNTSYHNHSSFTYDAVWSIALMLNKSIPLLREKNKTLEGMDYGDADGAKMMRDILFRTDFWGMSVC